MKRLKHKPSTWGIAFALVHTLLAGAVAYKWPDGSTRAHFLLFLLDLPLSIAWMSAKTHATFIACAFSAGTLWWYFLGLYSEVKLISRRTWRGD